MKVVLEITTIPAYSHAMQIVATAEDGTVHRVWVDAMDTKFPLIGWILAQTNQKPEAADILPRD